MGLFDIDEKELDKRILSSSEKLAKNYQKYDNDKDFYIGESELYVYNLLGWNGSSSMCQPYFDSCIIQCKKRNIDSFMDYGGGLGVLSILAKLNGIKKVYYIDYVDGLGKYALYLFKLFNVDIGMVDINSLSKFKTKIEAVALFDTLEHVENPVKVLHDILLNNDPKFIYSTVCWDKEDGKLPMHYDYRLIFPNFMSSFGFIQTVPSEFVRVVRWNE